MRTFRRWIILVLAGMLFYAGVEAAAAQTESPAEAEWYARYWNNMEQEGEPVLERSELVVDYNWGLGSPSSAVNPNRFSARWTSPVHFEAGTYRFTLTSDDGARVWLDDTYILNRWDHRPATTDEVIVYLQEGVHDLAIDYFEDGGYALISFGWERVSDTEDGSGSGEGETQVTIDPLRGPVGTEIDVRATGFTPGSTVTVGIGRAESETATSFQAEIPAGGLLETSITVPPSAEAGEPWRVLILGDEQRALSDDFIVTPAEGEAVSCGPTYIVRPNDWLSKIARNCDTTVPAILALNPHIDNPDRISVGTVLTMPGSEEPVEPQVTITPDSGPLGSTIRATAAGFEANVEVSVALRRPGELPITGMPVMTDDQGRLQATLDLPDAARPGDIWHVLVRSDERNAESEPFSVTWGQEATAIPRYNLNLRSGPGTDFADLDTVPAGTSVPVLEISPDENWVRVRYEGREGWIAAWLSDLRGALDEVPQSDEASQNDEAPESAEES